MGDKVNYKELHKETVKINNQIMELTGDRLVEIFTSPEFGKPIQAKVSWFGCGSKSAEDTKKFIAALQLATELAENFKYNGFEEEF